MTQYSNLFYHLAKVNSNILQNKVGYKIANYTKSTVNVIRALTKHQMGMQNTESLQKLLIVVSVITASKAMIITAICLIIVLARETLNTLQSSYL